MKVLFAGFKYEYGKPEWGLSNIEYQNFFGTLEKMQGVEASFFAADEVMREVGRDEMNQRLIGIVEDEKPDLLFTMIFQEEIKKETIKYITEKTRTKTFNWFTDDHWRFPVYSRFWAPFFTMVGTTDSKALEKYRALGINNAIKTQWGANHFLFKPQTPLNPPLVRGEIKKNSPPKIGGDRGGKTALDISFVGKKYGNREKYINRLKSSGLPAEGFGKGWLNPPRPPSLNKEGEQGGVVSFEKMLEIFSNSKINLNFTESPYANLIGRLKFLSRFIISREMGRWTPNFQFPISNFQSFIGAQRRQIKARTFEIPACGGFLLTQDADNLRDYYEDGREIVIFKDVRDMIEKCRYYLEHEEERQNIARAGYERTIKEHTYERRFREIFKAMELK